MGLPGAGKTYFSKILFPLINAVWLNADQVRKDADDWDFSTEGRVRQANRMKSLAQKALDQGKNVIADFVCPTDKTREDFNADVLIWMDTIKEGRFQDTNKIFINPKKFDFRITEKNAEIWAIKEAVFKAYGPGIDFKNDIVVKTPIENSKANVRFKDEEKNWMVQDVSCLTLALGPF